MSGINTSQLAQRIPNAQRSQPGLAHQRSPNSVPMGAPRPGGPAARVAISPAGQAAVNGAAVTTVVTAGRFLAVTIQNDAADIQSVTSGASINAGTTTLLLKLPKLAQGVRYQLASLSLSSSPGTRIAYSLIDSKGVARSITPSTPFTVASAGTYQLAIRAQNGTLGGTLSATLKGSAQLPASSGDSNIDSVLYGGRGFWQNIEQLLAGSGPAQGGTVITSKVKALAANSAKTVIKYGFLTSDPTNSNGFEALSNDAKAAVRSAFSYFSNLINVRFDETADQANADIAFGANTQEQSNGYAYIPNSTPTKNKTYVMLAKNGTYSQEPSFAPGSYNWSTIIHETGHALGLKHPGNYNAGGGGGTPPFLPANLDNQQYSMMSYNPSSYTQGVYYQTPMLFDVAALQYLYGVNQTGSTASSGSFRLTGNNVRTLYSKNTEDTIDLSALTRSSIVNLNAGEFSSINILSAAGSSYSGRNNVAIAYGSTINNVKLSNSAAEEVILNGAYSNKKFNTITQMGSNDTLTLKNSLFGPLTASNVLISANATKAISATTRLIVDSARGDIYLDRDGTGKKFNAVKIARYTGGATLSTSNFKFIV
ncbi:MAG: M10 family metallopeptidase [Betaproteobacteria bacterium]|jgi:hypothetical protein